MHLVGLIKENTDQECTEWTTSKLIPTTTVSIFQNPVPNYKDVDLSFSYKLFHSAFDFAKMDLTTPYEFARDIIIFMTQLAEQQYSSPQLQEFIRLAKLPILIAYTDMPGELNVILITTWWLQKLGKDWQ